MSDDPANRFLVELRSRRAFIRTAVAGTALLALGGELWALSSDEATTAARKQKLPDGRPRLPPGQRVIEALKPMGGQEGDPNPRHYRLQVHGAVRSPFVLDYAQLVAMGTLQQTCDVHCVTGWSALDQRFTGVRIADLAAQAGVLPTARHVVFEAAAGYTANVPLRDALAPACMVAHKLNGEFLARKHGGPARALVPGLYFWKSAKWLTGIRFVTADQPGYWEVRGYHNHADPWKEERYG